MSGHHPWPPKLLTTCPRCGKTFRDSLENDYKCPRCGFAPPELKLLAHILKKRKR